MKYWLILMVSTLSSLWARADDSFILKNYQDGTVVYKVLQVTKKSEIELDGILGMQSNKSRFLTSCWIMDAATRKTVWKPFLDDLDLLPGKKYSYEIDDTITLEPGLYYIFYSRNQSFKMMISGLEELKTFFEDVIIKIADKDSRFRSEEKNWVINVQYPETHVKAMDSYNPFWGKSYFIDLSDMGNNIYKKISFEIHHLSDQATLPIRIYAQGEGDKSDREMFDYGWITNRRGEHIWEMTAQNTQSAGGAIKNLKTDVIINLSNGDYTVVWITDDSHGFNRWNDQPPADPLCWGMVMELVNLSDTSHLRILDQRKKSAAEVDLTKIRDNQLISKPLILNKPSSLHIIAYGEYSSYSKNMADYAWIIRKNDRVKVWELTYQNSIWAGGSRKNRMVDDNIVLDEGVYEVYFVTDDSHAYDSWNDNPPVNPEQYGIQIFLSEKPIPSPTAPSVPSVPTKPSKPSTADPSVKNSEVIAQITKVGSNKMLQEKFFLSQTSRLKIVATGEGDRNKMYDYGWIAEVNTGRIVWKMLYENTSQAGGVEKNRVVNDQIILDKGLYRLFFTTDASHAYGDWNGEPPDNPSQYGIQISLIETIKN